MAVVIPIETKYNPRGTKTAIRDLESFKAAVDKAGGGFRGLAQVSGKVMQQVGRNVSNTGATLSRNVTLPLLALGAGAVVAFNQVDEGLDTVAAKSGATGKALQGLQGVFNNVAKTATQDMSTVGNVVGGLAGKFQITGKPLENLSNQLLTLARVNGADAISTTENVGSAMVALGIDANSAGGFLDSLLRASQRSGKGVDELAKLLATGAGTFNTYGISTNEALGLIGELSRAGIPATRVTAGLNSAFGKLVKLGEKDPAKALRDMFVEIRDSKDPTMATADAVALFGSRVGVTLAEGIRSGKISIDELDASLAGANGTLATAAKAVEGPQEKFARMKNEVMLLGASLVEELVPIFEQYVLPIIRKAIEFFQGLSPQMRQIVVIGGLIAAALGPFLAILGAIITGVGSLVVVIGAISGPVAAVIAGIAAFVAVLVTLWTTSETFRTTVIEVFNTVRAKIVEVVNLIKAKLHENRDAVEGLKNAFQTVWQFLQTTLIPLLVRFYGEYLKGVISAIGIAIGFVIDFISALYRFYQQVYRGIQVIAQFSAAMREKLGEVVTFFQELPGKIVAAFGNAGTMLFQTGRNIVMGLWNGLQSMGSWLSSSLMNWVKSVIPDPVERILGIASPSRVFEDIGSNLVLGLVEGLDQDGPRAVDAAQDLGRQIETDSVHVFEATGRTLAERMGKAFTDNVGPGGSVYAALQSAMDALASSLARTVTITVVENRVGGGGGGGGGVGGGGGTDFELAAQQAQAALSAGTGLFDPNVSLPGLPSMAEWLAAGSPQFAEGGSMRAGQLGLVGERGPELFRPTVSGRVIPNNALGGITVEAGAVQVMVNGGDRAEVQQAVDQAFQRLVRELAAL